MRKRSTRNTVMLYNIDTEEIRHVPLAEYERDYGPLCIDTYNETIRYNQCYELSFHFGG